MGVGVNKNKIRETPKAKLLRKYRNSNFSSVPNGKEDTPKTFSDWEEMGGTLTAIGWIQARKKWRRKH
mgnify:FL=1